MSKETKKVVSRDVATEDVKKWLDYKRYPKRKRDDHEDSIEVMVEAMCEGALILTEDNKLVQTLIWPIGDDGSITTLTYKPRLKMAEVETKSAKVKSSNLQGMIRAYVCALTEQNSGIIKELDTVDNSIAQAIATFFL